MALFNRTNLAFSGIVQGNELAIGSVGLRAFSGQGRLGEMVYWHLLLPQMPTFRFRASDIKAGSGWI